MHKHQYVYYSHHSTSGGLGFHLILQISHSVLVMDQPGGSDTSQLPNMSRVMQEMFELLINHTPQMYTEYNNRPPLVVWSPYSDALWLGWSRLIRTTILQHTDRVYISTIWVCCVRTGVLIAVIWYWNWFVWHWLLSLTTTRPFVCYCLWLSCSVHQCR